MEVDEVGGEGAEERISQAAWRMWDSTGLPR